jgi:single-stranded-DNA-specific exonuclease
MGKGSVRSYGGKDVLAALRASAAYLAGFGGHRHAAGLSLSPENMEKFAQSFDDTLGEMKEDADTLPLLMEGECSVEDLSVRVLQEIERLGPFGPGNPEPVVRVRASVQRHQVLKGRHLKLNLSPVGRSGLGEKRPVVLEAIWFHAAEKKELESFLSETDAEWAGVPELNRFRGQIKPTLRIRDWRKTREF